MVDCNFTIPSLSMKTDGIFVLPPPPPLNIKGPTISPVQLPPLQSTPPQCKVKAALNTNWDVSLQPYSARSWDGNVPVHIPNPPQLRLISPKTPTVRGVPSPTLRYSSVPSIDWTALSLSPGSIPVPPLDLSLQSIPMVQMTVEPITIRVPDVNVPSVIEFYSDYVSMFMDVNVPRSSSLRYDNYGLVQKMGWTPLNDREYRASMDYVVGLSNNLYNQFLDSVRVQRVAVQVEDRVRRFKHLCRINRATAELRLYRMNEITEALVKKYNADVVAYRASLEALSGYVKMAQAIVNRNQAAIKLGEEAIRANSKLNEFNQLAVRYIDSYISMAKGVVSLYNQQIGIAREINNINRENISAFRTAIEGFVSGLRTIIEYGEQVELQLASRKFEPLTDLMSAEQLKAQATKSRKSMDLQSRLETYRQERNVLLQRLDSLKNLRETLVERIKSETERVAAQSEGESLKASGEFMKLIGQALREGVQLEAVVAGANADIISEEIQTRGAIAAALYREISAVSEVKAAQIIAQADVDRAALLAKTRVCSTIIDAIGDREHGDDSEE